jgi:dihydroorotate dehydrogenase
VRPYDLAFRHLLTRVDAERAHHLGLGALRAGAPALRRLPVPGAPVEALGLRFPHPLGVAAGFDKNAVGIDALAGLGFGHVEVGTVTALPQPGNPRPRLFRLPADRAVLNRMGFNNDGAAEVSRRLAQRLRRRDPDRPGPVVGVNIGKSRVVPEEDQAAVEADHTASTGLLAPLADYLVVNVSSPNTPGLRSLQAVERLRPLLAAVRAQADAVTPDRRVPLLVKIAPDLADEDVLAVADLVAADGLDGVVATNTTVRRDHLVTPAEEVAALGPGGISGAPVAPRAREVLRLLRGRLPAGTTVVSVGGIDGPEEAAARLADGATLLQAYTGFVYGGAGWPRRVLRALSAAPAAAGGSPR